MIKEFLEKNPLPELDEKRQISDEQKIAAYSESPFCAECKRKFKDYKEPEYHHIKRYADGGETELDNILVICKECHDVIHGKKNIVDIEENDIPESDE
ncbi:MAG: HNH endonuclease signature motif containing protein [Bacteroidota bacterium]